MWRILVVARQQCLDVTCHICSEKIIPRKFFSTKCRQRNLGLIYHIVKRKFVYQNIWNCWSFTVDIKTLLLFFFLTSMHVQDIRRVPIDNWNAFRVRKLRASDIDVFLFFLSERPATSNSIIPFGKKIISELYTSWLYCYMLL